MSKRAIGIIGVLLAATLGGLLVYNNAADSPRSVPPEDSPGDPASKGGLPAKAAPSRNDARKHWVRLAGEVLDEGGLPIQGATVYVLDKKRRGANRDKVRHEVTDARGQWTLDVPKTIGCWIGVVAPGYRTAWIDGDGVDIAVKIIHAVERSPRFEVTVLDGAGAAMTEQGIQLAPWPPGSSWFCPGPSCRQAEQWGVTDDTGKAVFRQDVSAPVLVTPFIEGYHSHPSPGWVPDAAGALTVVVHPNVSLELHVSAATPLDKEDSLITLEFFDPKSARPVFSFTEALPKSGVVKLDRVLEPGTWHMQVTVPGRAPLLLQDVTIPEASKGGAVTVQDVALGARLKNAATPFTLRLTGNVAERRTRGRRRAPLVYFMRLDGRWPSLGWRVGAPESFDDALQRLQFTLSPGRYRVLVSDVLTSRAALAPSVIIGDGKGVDISLAMKNGQFGALPAVQDGARYVRRLEAHTADDTPLPIFGSSRDGKQRFSRGIDLIARKLLGEDVVVGPYPVDEFSLVLIHSDGSRSKTSSR